MSTFNPILTSNRDWISNCERLPECTIEVPYKIATVLEHHLRNEEKCDLVVALTHMRLADDTDLIRYANVDFAFGGHDHYIIRRDGSVYNTDPSVPEPGHEHERSTVTESANNVRLVKSGTDWKGISVLEIHLEREANGSASVRNYSCKDETTSDQELNADTIIQCNRSKISEVCQTTIQFLNHPKSSVSWTMSRNK